MKLIKSDHFGVNMLIFSINVVHHLLCSSMVGRVTLALHLVFGTLCAYQSLDMHGKPAKAAVNPGLK